MSSPKPPAISGEIKAVIDCLGHTYNPDDTLRKHAESQLKMLESKAGYLQCLLRIILITEVHQDVRQAASLRLKNIVSEYWDIREGDLNKISTEDRKVIKDNILESIIAQNSQLLRNQLLESMFKIARGDFPDSWKELIPSIMKNINSGQKNRVYGATCALRIIYKRFRFSDKERRKPVDEMIKLTYPTLFELFKSIIKNHTWDTFEMSRQIIKIFFLTTSLILPMYLRNPTIFTGWMELLLEVFQTPLPKDQADRCKTQEELRMHPLWKCKKWVSLIFNRIFSRYGHPKCIDEDDEKEDKDIKAFSEMFFTKFSEPLMLAFMKLLKFRKEGGAVTSRVLQLSMNYISLCFAYSKLYKKLKPHLVFIIQDAIFPALTLQPDDLEMWTENPNEFVRRSLDLLEEFFHPRVAATNLLCEMIKLRAQDSLPIVTKTVTAVLTTYATAPLASRNTLQKEGALRMFGGIRKFLMSKAKYHEEAEKVIVTHVFPEFKSTQPYLRAAACWIVGQYAKLKFQNTDNNAMAVKLTTTCLTDKELPVRLEAALAVSRIVSLATPTIVDILRPHIKAILEQYFLLIDEIGHDAVISTLGDFCFCMGKDVAPYALAIVKKMTGLFMEFVKADPEDDEAALSAAQCLGTISVILNAIQSLPEMYPEMEKIVAPILDKMICPDGIEYYEDILEIITCFTFYSKTISDFMWTLCPRIIQSLDDWAGDYLGNVVSPIDNFISRGTERFLATTSPNLLVGVLTLCERWCDNEESHETEAAHAAHLFETIVAHFNGKIDTYVPQIIKLAGKNINESKTVKKKAKPITLLNIDVLAGCVHYNPVLFLSVCKQGGDKWTTTLFTKWLASLKDMGGYKQQKMSVIGLSSLLRVKASMLPKGVQTLLPQILEGLCSLLERIGRETEKREKKKKEEEAEDPHEVEEIGEIDEDEDAEDEIQSVTGFTRQVQRGIQEAEEENSTLIADDEFQSPYDEIDEFVYWMNAMQELNRNEPVFAKQWSSKLPPKGKELMDTLVAEAQKRASGEKEGKEKTKEKTKGKKKEDDMST